MPAETPKREAVRDWRFWSVLIGLSGVVSLMRSDFVWGYGFAGRVGFGHGSGCGGRSELQMCFCGLGSGGRGLDGAGR